MKQAEIGTVIAQRSFTFSTIKPKKMKPILLLLTMMLGGNLAFSQNCNFYYLQDGKTAEITFYTKKGDESGKGVYNVTSAS